MNLWVCFWLFHRQTNKGFAENFEFCGEEYWDGDWHLWEAWGFETSNPWHESVAASEWQCKWSGVKIVEHISQA